MQSVLSLLYLYVHDALIYLRPTKIYIFMWNQGSDRSVFFLLLQKYLCIKYLRCYPERSTVYLSTNISANLPRPVRRCEIQRDVWCIQGAVCGRISQVTDLSLNWDQLSPGQHVFLWHNKDFISFPDCTLGCGTATALATGGAEGEQRLTKRNGSLWNTSVSWSDLLCTELCNINGGDEQRAQVLNWRVWRICQKYFSH